MPRLWPIDRQTAPAAMQKLLADVEEKLGMVPNLIATMAQSTSVARGYLDLAESLSSGVLAEPLREQIALAVSQANGCDYCVAGHSAVGSSIGLTEDELRDARNATSPDRKTEAVLQFARRIVDTRGAVSDDDIVLANSAAADAKTPTSPSASKPRFHHRPVRRGAIKGRRARGDCGALRASGMVSIAMGLSGLSVGSNC